MAPISCISLFFCKHAKLAARGRTRGFAQQKNPARHAAQAPGVVSVSIFFWKILVTRVKRKIEQPLSPSIGTGSAGQLPAMTEDDRPRYRTHPFRRARALKTLPL
jgi:hypothetical protein